MPTKRRWTNKERWRTARLVIRVVLVYSPRSVGTALIVAGHLIRAIDQTWEKKDVRPDKPVQGV